MPPAGNEDGNGRDECLDGWREPPGWLGEYVRRVKRLMAEQNPPQEQPDALPSG